MMRVNGFFLGAALLWSTAAFCQSQPKFLSAGEIDAAVIVAPPPADDSPQTKSELVEVRRLIHDSSPERLEKAKYDDRTEELVVFSDVLGFDIKQSELPTTWQMFRDVRYEETVAVDYAKQLFKRPRPFELDRTIEHCSLAQPNTSYPSGHADYIYATATVLAALVPEKAAAINKRSDDYAESRLICGMHFRSDIVAGKKLGTHVGTSLLKNTAFKAEFEAATAEIAARGNGLASGPSAPSRKELPVGGGLTEKGKAMGLTGTAGQ